MSGRREALILAAIHIALVASLGLILLVDRAVRPRIWAKTVLIDPEARLYGRYVRLRIEVDAENALIGNDVLLSVRDGHLSASRAVSPTGIWLRRSDPSSAATTSTMQVNPPLDFFVAQILIEHWRGPGGREKYQEGRPVWDEAVEVWAEVTLPRRGPPRPIRLGIKKDGVVTPL